MRLKIRSPYKSPSKAMLNKRVVLGQESHSARRSPRISKDKQIISNDETNNRKRKSYLITDTPDHKQNSTIITTRQEKLRKRFSFQQFNTAPAQLPVIPDTPVKSKISFLTSSCSPIFIYFFVFIDENNNSNEAVTTQQPHIINPRCTGLNFNAHRLYASPRKNVTLE